MSATTLPSPAPTPAPARDGGRVAAIVVGALLALLALPLFAAGAAGLWADTTQRDSGGWLNSPWHHFDTDTRALTAEGLDLGGPADRLPDFGALRLRARAADGGPIFVGIAPEARVDAFLRGVAHSEVTEVRRHGYRGVERAGTRVPRDPEGTLRWTAAASGPGTQTVRWEPRSGRWAVVVMNPDGRAGLSVDLRVGARASWLLPVALALLATALLLGAGSVALIVYGAGRPTPTGVAAPERAPAEIPVQITAHLDEPLSRWLWLVKWLLLIPHLVILAVLWPAFVLVTLVAMVAIVVTGRYPRRLFDFNVGVLRWSWRVGFYGCSAFATDRYPPFSLRPDPDYPADVEIGYPERLSRWKALLKPWLLALPHYAALAALLGGWNLASIDAPGLLGVLLIVAVVLLAVRGRYPRDIFALVVGINRWALRVAAYAGLMRDEYPPFRLDR